MRRRKAPDTWFRRLSAPVRAFLKVDLDMTQQALRNATPATVAVMCAPSLFVLWILDETDAAIGDLRRLLSPRRPSPDAE